MHKGKSHKSYIQKPKANKWILMIFLIAVPITMCLAEVVMQFYILGMFKESLCAKTCAEISLLEAIMSLISIAVSVWIGLNIYNVYKREDMDDTLNAIQSSVYELNYENKKRKFLWELEKGEHAYDISRYLCKMFEPEEDIPLEILDKLCSYEKQFYWTYMAYERHSRDEGGRLAWELLIETNRIQNLLEKYEVPKHSILRQYMNIRKADLLYYKNCVLNKPIKDEYIESIELYKKELKSIPSDEKKVMGYMQNTIGYTYNLLCRTEFDEPKVEELPEKKGFFANLFSRKEKKAEKKLPIEDEKEIWAKEAEEYLKECVKNNQKGRYYQNLGSYYEIIKNDYRLALEQYKLALGTEKKDNKIYNLMGALLLKQVEQELDLNGRFEVEKTLNQIAENNIPDKVKERIHEAYDWLDLSLKVLNPVVNSYYNYSKACIYFALFVDGTENELYKAWRFLNIVAPCIEEQNNKENLLPVPNGYLFTLRSYYEAKQEYNKALDINEILMTKMPQNNELEKAKKLYEKKKGESKVKC